MATERDIDALATVLVESLKIEDETLGIEAAVGLLVILIKSQVRIADALENGRLVIPKPLSEMRFGGL